VVVSHMCSGLCIITCVVGGQGTLYAVGGSALVYVMLIVAFGATLVK